MLVGFPKRTFYEALRFSNELDLGTPCRIDLFIEAIDLYVGTIDLFIEAIELFPEATYLFIEGMCLCM